MSTFVTLCEPLYIGILHYTLGCDIITLGFLTTTLGFIIQSLGFANQPCPINLYIWFNNVLTLGVFTTSWHYSQVPTNDYIRCEKLLVTQHLYTCVHSILRGTMDS